ncbi:MAG: pitrilysin family protein [Candidatus Eisenbacteria bacterium]|nr:pitrilysin family protein [Candidatus Eisenbacteria bacterium]
MRSSTVLLVLFTVFLASSSQAQWTDKTLADKVQEFTLSNGMRFLVVERHNAPVFFATITFKVGSVDERPGITGISHFLEHMMFKGTQYIGTRDYGKEKPFLAKEDSLAHVMMALQDSIRPWRLDVLERYGLDALAAQSQKPKKEPKTKGLARGEEHLTVDALGDRLAQLGDLLGILKNPYPDSLTSRPSLLSEGGVNYAKLFYGLKNAERELEATQKEHIGLLVQNEFWDTYLRAGARVLNAGTGEDNTTYLVYLPSNQLELWMLMESDRLGSIVFRQFYSERNVVQEERRLGENDPDEALYEPFMATAFTAHPYGVPVVGWMSDLRHIDRTQMEAQYRRYYNPTNAVAALVGDIKFDEARALAEKYFSRLPAQPKPPEVITQEPEQKGERRLTVQADAGPQLMMGFHIPTVPHPDAYALTVLAEVLARGRTSRLYQSIFEKQQLTLSGPNVWTGPGERYDHLFVISAEPQEPHTLKEVEDALWKEIDNIKASPPTQRELERLKNQLDANLIRSLGSNPGLAFRLGDAAANRGDWRAILSDREKLLGVTPADVQRVAKKYLTHENVTVGYRVRAEKSEDEGGGR